MNPLYRSMIDDMIVEAEDGTFSDANEDMVIGTIDDRLDGEQQIVLHDEDEELDDDTDKVTEEDMDYEFGE